MQKSLNARIDSLQVKLHEADSIAVNKTIAERKRWMEYRLRLKARIDRLKTQRESIGTMTKDRMNKFQMEVDTSISNLKADWNNMLEHLKAK